MDNPQPIKRSEELAPLSREHHEGLLLGWKIRQGLKNGTGIDQIGNYVQWFWDQNLQKHFLEEENLLMPIAPQSEFLQQMLDEHIAIKHMIDQANWDEEKLNKLADDLSAHIRFEERVLFPFIEKQASAEQLQHIGQHLHKEEKNSAVWEDEFWIKKP